MTSRTMLKTVILGAFVALAVTVQTHAATISPAGDGPPECPYGTVDAQDVQAAFGWSNQQLTEAALASPDHLLFRYELVTRYRVTCDNGELYPYDIAYVMRLTATPQGEHNVHEFYLMSPGLTSAPPPTPVPAVGTPCPWDAEAVVVDVVQPAPVVRAVIEARGFLPPSVVLNSPILRSESYRPSSLQSLLRAGHGPSGVSPLVLAASLPLR